MWSTIDYAEKESVEYDAIPIYSWEHMRSLEQKELAM